MIKTTYSKLKKKTLTSQYDPSPQTQIQLTHEIFFSEKKIIIDYEDYFILCCTIIYVNNS